MSLYNEQGVSTVTCYKVAQLKRECVSFRVLSSILKYSRGDRANRKTVRRLTCFRGVRGRRPASRVWTDRDRDACDLMRHYRHFPLPLVSGKKGKGGWAGEEQSRENEVTNRFELPDR